MSRQTLKSEEWEESGWFGKDVEKILGFDWMSTCGKAFLVKGFAVSGWLHPIQPLGIQAMWLLLFEKLWWTPSSSSAWLFSIVRVLMSPQTPCHQRRHCICWAFLHCYHRCLRNSDDWAKQCSDWQGAHWHPQSRSTFEVVTCKNLVIRVHKQFFYDKLNI